MAASLAVGMILAEWGWLTIMLIGCGCIPFSDTCRMPAVGKHCRVGIVGWSNPLPGSGVPGEAAVIIHLLVGSVPRGQDQRSS